MIDAPVDIDAGFEVAPGDDTDVHVVNTHGWGSGGMVFSDGGFAYTAVDLAEEVENGQIERWCWKFPSRGSESTNEW